MALIRYIKKVVLGLFGRMVRHLNNTARVQMANTLGGQDVVIGNLLKKGVFMEELKDQVIFILKERETAEYTYFRTVKAKFIIEKSCSEVSPLEQDTDNVS